MTSTHPNREQSLEILIDELVTDEEFRESFLRNPRQTLNLVVDWGLPLSESEILSLVTSRSLWDRLVEELDVRLQKAA
jgi:hypothetical protein